MVIQQVALTKTMTNDKIEVLQLAAGYPVVQVRTATVISEDGVEISRTFHRHVLTPECTLNGDIAKEHKDVIDIAQAVFTGAALDAWNAAKASGEV